MKNVLFLSLLLAACGGNAAVGDRADAEVPSDASVLVDSSTFDAELAADASVADAAADASTAALPGFGAIAGPCGRVAAEINSDMPSYFVTRLDFMSDGFDSADTSLLTAGGQEILSEGTAGGSSGESEVFAFEVLARCEGATLVKSETEIVYDPPTSKKTDMLVSIGGDNVGVSVVRAFGFPPTDPYTEEDATTIMERKLDDILVSSTNVVAADAWTKQVLVVVAYADMHAESVRAAWENLDEATRADTIVYVVITDGDDDAIY